MRVTYHNSRRGSAKHNDRDFDVSKASHIDADKVKENKLWCCYQGMTFKEAERRFYAEHFETAIETQNEKYRARRQQCYCKTIDDYLESEKTRPEETLYAIGKKDDCASKGVLLSVVSEFVEWHREIFPNAVLLNSALHVDESGVCHMHNRQVWIARDKNGNEIVSQNQALKAMGITGEDKTVIDEQGKTRVLKWGSRYNNAKIEYTRQCRERIEEICRAHGITLDAGRLEKSRTGRTLDDYKASQAEKRLATAKNELQKVVAESQAELMRLEERRSVILAECKYLTQADKIKAKQFAESFAKKIKQKPQNTR